MATRFKITKISRGVMLQISRITFYLSVDESETMARLLNEAIRPMGKSSLTEGPRATGEGLGQEGDRTEALGGPEASLEALKPSEIGPKTGPIEGPRANEEAQRPGGPITEALGGPEASSVALEPREERPKGRGSARPRHSPTGSEPELKERTASALTTNRNKQ